MYKSKRDVDRYVSEVERNTKSETERALKGWSIAKLYYTVGSYQLALVYLDKYDSARKGSAASLNLRGQVYEALSATAEVGEKSRLQALALQSYRRSVELDLSQTNLLLKICELMLQLPVEESGKATYWVEEAEKIYPKNTTLKKLREKIVRASGEGDGHSTDLHSAELADEEVNGNGAATGNESDDNTAFWSASTGGGSFFLNNSLARLDMRDTSTPRTGGGSASLLVNSQTRRFAPRPSPERLAAQVKSLESSQEKLLNAIQETGKGQTETLEAILQELRVMREDRIKMKEDEAKSKREVGEVQTAILDELRSLKEDTNRHMRDNTRALKETTSELTSLCNDVKRQMKDNTVEVTRQLQDNMTEVSRQMKALVAATKNSRDETDEEVHRSKPRAEPDINDLLMQQYARLPPAHLLAFLQMNQLAAAGLAPPPPPVVPNLAAAPFMPIAPPPLQAAVPAATARPPASVLDMAASSGSGSVAGNTWPAATPTPQFPLPASNVVVNTATPPAKETIKPQAVGTPLSTTPRGGLAAPSASSTLTPSTPIVTSKKETTNSPFSTFSSSPFAISSSSNAPATPVGKQLTVPGGTTSLFNTLNNTGTPTSGFSFSTPTNGPQQSISTTTPLSSLVTPKKETTSSLAGFSFAAAAAEASQRASTGGDDHDEGGHDESADHDPHFEPIIPLPELVQVKTGEEEEEELFAFKAKAFRFDPEAKEWKERGVGILKILKHPGKGTFRVLLRREQVHKVAVNHSITKEIELKPLQNSATALCYYAMDFAEEELKLEHLAVRFKLEETKDQFKKIFEQCQEELRKRVTPIKTNGETDKEKSKPAASVVKDLSSLEQFKPKAGSWECGGCFCRNKSEDIICPACQTPQPGKENEAAKASSSALNVSAKFGGFGGSPSTGSGFNLAPTTSASTPSGFKFGTSPATSATSGFSFGTPATTAAPATTKPPVGGFSFGTPSTTSIPAPTSGFSFGKKPEESTTVASATASFTFTKPPVKVESAPAAEEKKPSPFAGFSFGVTPKEETKTDASSTFDISASKNLASFADLASNTKSGGFGFGAAGGSSSFAFSGAGAPVFGGNRAATSGGAKKDDAENDGDDDGHVDNGDHDPHFEPIIPLPELVQVKTGEEEEEELFGFKGKMYRFDPEAKEWKERGVGKVKILKHTVKGTYRVLLRREQVHKVAVNHMITKDIELKPLNSSTTALCYYAVDFAEEELKLEHLAVRFKSEETIQEFKQVFEKCQKELAEKGSSPVKQESKKEPVNDKCKGLKDKVEDLTAFIAKGWECSGCFCKNDISLTVCPACQTPKPGTEAAKPAVAPSTSIFGGASTGSASGFSFSSFAPAAANTSSTSIFGGLGGTAAKVEELKVVATADKEELSFENLGLKLNSASDAVQVAEKISQTKSMKTLTFSGNTIGIEAAGAIGKSLETHPEFERAHWKDMFTGRMKTEIPPALKHLSRGIMTAQAHLVELDLSDNAFGPIGMDGIVDLLKSPSCYTLKELRLNNTGCGVTGGKVLAKTLLEAYENSGKTFALRVFVLGRSRQENEGAKALAQVFKLMGSLEEVVMPQNGIYHEGISALSDAFANNPNLQILNMNDNTFTEKGAAALAKALPNLSRLKILNLGDCLLKTQGAKLIADALKNGHTDLEELYLDSNEIRFEGGEAIVAAVANKSNLKTLKIDANQFGADGCGKLIKKLQDVGQRHVLDEIEDDEEPDDDDGDEEGQEDEDDSVRVDRARHANSDDDEDDEDEDEEDNSNVMFDGVCNLSERKKEVMTSLGQVSLRIEYDDDVYGARIIATDPEEEEDEDEPKYICNHLIAMQTVLTANDDFTKLEWSALDFSLDPPAYRHFTAEFEDKDMGREFRDVFTEGKELAEQSEILEQAEVNPEEMVYGEGGDYDD